MVLVVDGEVVASSDDSEAMFREAMRYPAEKAVVTKVLFPGASFY